MLVLLSVKMAVPIMRSQSFAKLVTTHFVSALNYALLFMMANDSCYLA